MAKTFRKCIVTIGLLDAWSSWRKVPINGGQPLSRGTRCVLHLSSFFVPSHSQWRWALRLTFRAVYHNANKIAQASPIILINEIHPADMQNGVSESGHLPSIAYVFCFSLTRSRVEEESNAICILPLSFLFVFFQLVDRLIIFHRNFLDSQSIAFLTLNVYIYLFLL